MAAARIPRPNTSPYFGVQKRNGGYVAETRNLTYENMDLGCRFYHRTADELEAAFLIDATNHFGSNKKNYSYNFANGQTVLTVFGPLYQKSLDERLAKSCPGEEYRDHVSKEYKSFLINEVKKLWETHHEYILRDHVRPLYQGSSKPSSRQIIQGEHWIGKETEEVILRNTENQGLSAKFDVDGGLVLRAPRKERDLKKNVSLPPALEEHQGSHSGTQINRDEGIDGSSAMSGENLDNMVLHMKIRCAEFKNWWKVAAEFIASYSQKREMKLLVHEIAPMLKLCEALQYPSKQGGPEFAQMHIESQQRSQCALYEHIYDIVTKFVDSECPPEEIERYQAETGPIIQRCRANWHY